MIDPSHAVAGALTGFLVGLTGVGGGALMTPVLLLVFGVAPTTAVATDLWFAALTKLAGAGVHHRAGQVDWSVARRLWLGSLPVAVLTVSSTVWGAGLVKVSALTQAIGAVVALTGLGLWVAPWLLSQARARRLGDPQGFKRLQPALTVLAGAVLGLLVALTSVGAGALGSVLLLYLYPLRMTPHRLVATDLVHAIPLALTAGLAYLWAGQVDVGLLLGLLSGSLPAIVLGSWWARHVPARRLQVILALVLLAVGSQVLWGTPGPGH